MPKFRRPHHFPTINYKKSLDLWTLGLMVFFHSLFDGIVGFMVPLLILANGFSLSEMGLIYSTSSICGAIFDILLSKFLKNSNFRRLYLFNFVVCLFFPLILFQAKALPLFLLAMALWGLYYDLLNFGHFNFISRFTKPDQHVSSFGVLDMFRNLGLLTAPLIAGVFASELDKNTTLLFALGILACSFVAYILLNIFSKNKKPVNPEPVFKAKGIWHEINSWVKLWKYIAPVLLFLCFINIVDAFFWTVGPLFSEELAEIHPFGGVFLTFYFLPALFVGLFVGKVTLKWGKKRTAFVSLFFASFSLLAMSFATFATTIILLTSIASFFFAMGWPSIRGAVADYISESTRNESELEGVTDFSINIGYILGPAFAGISADIFGNQKSFGVLGIVGLVFSLALFFFTRRSIIIPKRLE